ncbi:MAG: extracellular solute-binding protein [Candidatus Pacebacteria bacterium]|nr:extracellular solute-binding protein [Candidatus Paceibacterota bacterium]
MAQTDGSQQSIFQFALLGIFVVLAVGGVALLAMYKTKTSNVITYPITIWGPTFMGEDVPTMLRDLEEKDQKFSKITYVAKNPFTLYGDILEAIATGKAPDLVVLDQSSLLSLKNKLQPVPYTSYPLRTYRDTFVEGAEVFAQPEGIYAFPFAVDPIILYWNRDLFTNAGIAQVPQDWDTFVKLVPTLSKIVGGADLVQSAIAFGEYENVLHAKEIMSALLLQTGTTITQYDGQEYKSTLKGSSGELALTFYTDFSNPIKNVYSWNKTFDRSREAFAANKVAMYAGFASELSILPQINPNLNFDITLFPQSISHTNQVTYGKFYGIALLSSSPYKNRAYEVVQLLSSKLATADWQKATLLPSTRRDSLVEDPNSPYSHTMVRSAIIARSWLEPGRNDTDNLFRQLINDVVTGKGSPSTSLGRVHDEMDVLLSGYAKK